MLKQAHLFFLLLVASHGLLAQQTTAKLALTDFLQQFYNFSALPQYLPVTDATEVSTYDRTGGNNDGFNGTYSFVTRNADSLLVIFDQKGPGVINRIWTPTPTDDTLDFYIDDLQHAAFSLRYRDLYTGKVYPFTAPLCANQLGGFYAYLPIPFNKACKIVLRAKTTRFHQIGYHLYSAGTAIKSFSLPLNKEEQQALEKISSSWNKSDPAVKDFYDATAGIQEVKKIITLRPGQAATVFQSQTGGRIAGFEIVSGAALDTLAKNIDLKITWDGEQYPAVYAPLADDFGYAFGTASMKGLLVGSDGKQHYSRFPMPYDRSAKIELVYRGGSTTNELSAVTLLCKVFTQNNKRNPATEGKFYAQWNRQNPVPTGQPYTMLKVKGKGHFAGVALQAQGLVPGITGFFEGDDSTVVDGKLKFHGTGSEDFFNGGWYALLDCWDDAMSLPLSGALDYSIPLARTGGYRFFINDKIPFNNRLLHTIEHGPEKNEWPADYTSVSYYYCDRPNEQPLLPTNANTKIYQPDTLEIYPQLTFTATDENVASIPKWDGTPAKTMYYTIGNESLLKMYLQDVPAGNYDMYLDYQKNTDAAQFSLWQRQTQLTDWIDAHAASQQKMAMQKTATIRVTDLNRSLSFRFKTTAERDKFILGRIILIRKK